MQLTKKKKKKKLGRNINIACFQKKELGLERRSSRTRCFTDMRQQTTLTLLQLSNTSIVSILSHYRATEEKFHFLYIMVLLCFDCFLLLFFFSFFFSLFFFLEKYKNTTMVLIVTARDTNNTRSVRIWWQREFFFSQQNLRRACEIGFLRHHATS